MNHKKNIKAFILNKIHGDELSMHSKYYFLFRFMAIVFVGVVVLVLSVFILNFILFSIRISGHGNLLSFGWKGFFKFLLIFPWFLLFLDIIFIAILEWLLRKFSLGYKLPVLHLLFIVLFFTLSAGLFIDRGTSFNDVLLDRAEKHRFPALMNNFFKGAKNLPKPNTDICLCTIVSIEEGRLIAKDERLLDSPIFTIIIPEDNSSIDYEFIREGNTVFIAGELHEDVLYAFGLHAENPRPMRR